MICLLCVLSRIHTLFPEHQAQLGPCDCRLLSIGCQRPLITTAHQLHSFRYKPGLCICCKSHHTCLSQLVRLHSVKPSFLADQLSPQPKQLCHIKGALLAGSFSNPTSEIMFLQLCIHCCRSSCSGYWGSLEFQTSRPATTCMLW